MNGTLSCSCRSLAKLKIRFGTLAKLTEFHNDYRRWKEEELANETISQDEVDLCEVHLSEIQTAIDAWAEELN